MKMIVGLGNPGRKYAGTKHNMGFMVVDELAKRLGLKLDKLEFDAATATTRIHDEKVFLVKPQTYMNASGRAVRELMMFYQIRLDEILVVHDDMDLTLGKLRLRQRGSAGGHNGIKDIISATGSDEFYRLKIGIQHPQRQRVVDWVLTPFSQADQPMIDEAITRADDALEDWLNGMPFPQLMNKFN
ncbi:MULTISPECIES: aminoacyl-tRNA hydrolase [Lacticaseibacillus]|uniref:Peptidyl-tRNA hydrolase n=2 Tax=Lacticaseibacillus TaxID=2759736 RepID=A0AAN1F0F1_LACCA|nr:MULTISPECIES: aminoacyl-tRNA hydrolase [Lacticaseibacillus]ARY92489.1 aminoacyl-tRNA hydrolase [Lacticaseibacillus casei]KAB1969673.1 aminoacyl-tRNA hydrolase [Lacticaseibacillus casei]WLV80391.1 aminoacyl-tRNA hydrolase [Lacticaseibacillus sp. NCIMB 15473]WNX24352.1 aminoacyl-tRNA hydrolase [Lacticaseibacillus casei]WNX27125.1 aminoacyl-tRNA hydrolase [Lacticaseibacillus casei]